MSFPLFLAAGLLGAACTPEPGPAGPAGQACAVTQNADGSATITCADGSQATVEKGPAGGACKVTTQTDGSKLISCLDGTTATVTNGTNGTNGTPCTVVANADGTKTVSCPDGTKVVIKDGAPAPIEFGTGANVRVTDFHGAAALAREELAEAQKYFAQAKIDSVTADAAGVVTVNFTLKDDKGKALAGQKGMGFNVSKLVPAAGDVSYNKWVPYIYTLATVSGSATGNWPSPDGTKANQGSRETNGTLTDKGDGTYTYVFATNLATAKKPLDQSLVGYDRALTHRVTLMMGGHNGPTATAFYDFVPAGGAVTEKREIVQTDTCKQCHGPEFAAHGGDRLIVENCVSCHNQETVDPESGNTVDFKQMIHKIHAGGELASIAGADGIVWDDPNTSVDESADNGHYAIWGYGKNKFEWWKVEFPAVIENCTKCHTGTGAQVDNWKTKPSRAACGSCHDTVNFTTGTGHGGGAQTSDATCAACHPATGSISPGVSYPVEAAHDWTVKDPRNIPEFKLDLTVSAPANGKYFVAGEAPVVTVVLKDPATGNPIDHTTMVADTAAEGCLDTGCPAADGKFMASGLYVSGPRARRSPVLTTAARAKIFSATVGPWDLSATGASLVLKVDGGLDIMKVVNGADTLLPGTITVAVPATGIFADKTVATADEVVNWLNANANFKARAIAYVEGGKVGIRSRNLGKEFSLQLQASAVTTTVFGGDVAVKTLGGSTISAPLTSTTDPKVTRLADKVTYQLDKVDDLAPGTYVAKVEISDRGRISETNYRTPTVGKVTFQVGQEKEELPVAGNCNSCHQNKDGKGYILDFGRHNKAFDFNAVDTCGSCHDYQAQNATGNWSGAVPIARRVHAVHFGSELNYPNTTVGHADGIPARNWDIEFPQDVRQCQSCHPDGKTSGTWATNPNRIACGGCHDSDAATGHMKQQTWDPTPADPYSGDETETCKVCH